MKAVAKVMTNINPRYYEFLEFYSKKNKVTKKQIIEAALDKYIKFLKEEKIKKEYESMGRDKKYLDEMQNNSQYLSFI